MRSKKVAVVRSGSASATYLTRPGRASFSSTRPGALQAGSHQSGLVDQFNASFGDAVYYLLYNPPRTPLTVEYPLRQRIRVDEAPLGCRVLEAGYVHGKLAELCEGLSPTLASIGQASGWTLEYWAADLLLTCKVGRMFDDANDRDVRYLLERRSGPIGAALAASITLPE